MFVLFLKETRQSVNLPHLQGKFEFLKLTTQHLGGNMYANMTLNMTLKISDNLPHRVLSLFHFSTFFLLGCSLRLGCGFTFKKYLESLNELKKYLDHAHRKKHEKS
jgi:hypothetical protein